MKILWVMASPDRSSLTNALQEEGLRALKEAGHEYQVSDLYGMRWEAVVGRDDFGQEASQPLIVTTSSERAYTQGTLSADIVKEQEKLDWADAVVFSFPLWWYGMPAILKGWFDRVFVQGYAYRVKDPADPRRTLRYGEGNLAGKRALVLVSCGSPEAAVGPRGISGQLDEVLFPLLHGTLWYTGMSVLPPVCIHNADRIDEEGFLAAADTVRAAVLDLPTTEPIPYRYQNFGDYEHGSLREDLLPGQTGLSIHTLTPVG
ncbi:NAD(P)H-dependent oxidoreductase [Paenarthrobacter sp. NPDC058040]|uniref:NAD(P)H-dependent oxidoreductase n=1 Tax=unclassified Paenarthrobacter TaxID=2634190 RepID=UPI0036DBF1E1